MKKAAEIDPNFCDVHQQFSTVYFQQKNILKFEEHLTKAVLCPFTMGGSQANFQQYWALITRDPVSGPEANKRYQRHLSTIQAAIKEAIEKEEMEKRAKGQDQSSSDEL